MSSHTLTFPSENDVSVDGTTVTSPYTLTKNCSISVYSSGAGFGVMINGQPYTTSTTISLSQVDITIGGKTVPSMGEETVHVTINYTA